MLALHRTKKFEKDYKLMIKRDPHHVFIKEGIKRPVVVPSHGNANLGKFAEDIFKEAGIKDGGKK